MKVRYPSLESLYEGVDNFIEANGSLRPPLIGISANRRDGLSCIAETYVQAVAEAGGAPLLIPVINDIRLLSAIVSSLDGLLMSGGSDINPILIGEEPIPQLQDVDPFRDEYDFMLLRLAMNRQLPIMGICRGHQILNVAFGGTIYQDIHSQSGRKLLKHSQAMAREFASHTVKIGSSSRHMKELLDGVDTLKVNSFHHQAVDRVAPDFITAAEAPDGINEAIEHKERAIFGVQWHPEAMAANGDEVMKRLFEHHVGNSRIFARAKALHDRIVTIDSHTDTPMIFPGDFNIGLKEGGKVNLPFMEEGKIDCAFMVAYIPQGDRDEVSLKRATDYAVERLNQVKRQQELNPDRMAIATTPAEILAIKRQGKRAICLGVENGYAIGKGLSNIKMFRDMGVSYITLCHNGDNDICDSARGNSEWNGLSPFGKDVVREMNWLGLMVDLSHASERSFYDAIEVSETPIICSHSSARELCDHPRNLTDDQIRAIAATGGVVQVCLYKGFINPDAENASLSDAIRHIHHIVDLVGVDHVGIGSDFDGDGELIGCSATNELINITVKLLENGYSDSDIEKIWGGNLLRVMEIVQRNRRM